MIVPLIFALFRLILLFKLSTVLFGKRLFSVVKHKHFLMYYKNKHTKPIDIPHKLVR